MAQGRGAGMADDRDARSAQLEAENAALRAEVGRLRPAVSDALEQQTATAGVLRVIAPSPTDLQAVLDAVVNSAARFCGARDAEIYHLSEGSLKAAAHCGPIPGPAGRLIPVARGRVAGRAIIESQAI